MGVMRGREERGFDTIIQVAGLPKPIDTFISAGSTRTYHPVLTTPSLLTLINHYGRILRQGLVRLAELVLSVSERTIVSKFTLAFDLEEFADLCFIVAVGYVHHLHHELVGERLQKRNGSEKLIFYAQNSLIFLNTKF